MEDTATKTRQRTSTLARDMHAMTGGSGTFPGDPSSPMLTAICMQATRRPRQEGGASSLRMAGSRVRRCKHYRPYSSTKQEASQGTLYTTGLLHMPHLKAYGVRTAASSPDVDDGRAKLSAHGQALQQAHDGEQDGGDNTGGVASSGVGGQHTNHNSGDLLGERAEMMGGSGSAPALGKFTMNP